MKIDFNQVIKNLEGKAKVFYVDKDRLKGLLNSAKKLLEENDQLKGVVQDITTMIHLLKDWIKGDYKDLSKSTIMLIITALLYLVIPLDIIPDFLPLGFLDDIVVIGFVIKKISDEINKYKEWKGIVNVDSIEIDLDSENSYSSEKIKGIDKEHLNE